MSNNKLEINWNKSNAFSGKYEFLSNFYPATVEYAGYLYPTSEHAFAAQKASTGQQRGWIAIAESPGEAKMRGRRCTLRADWEEIKDNVMLTIVRDKFIRHQDLAQRLLETGEAEIVEWNSWGDTHWGKIIVGIGPQGQQIENGKNMLGKILMRVRTEIRDKDYILQTER